MPRILHTLDEVRSLVGEVVGVSPWRTISQELVDRFADVTDDRQFIHVDLERAKEGPFGRPVAHGLLILSLAPSMLQDVARFDRASMVVNCGFDRIRFAGPVPVGERVRISVTVVDVDQLDDGFDVVLKLSYELEGRRRPVCRAELLLRVVE